MAAHQLLHLSSPPPRLRLARLIRFLDRLRGAANVSFSLKLEFRPAALLRERVQSSSERM